ncbi:4Fe-4S binding protein [Thermosediminibacter litoriperuensis]|uniref:4Fe-4S binding protein n=1 Tax=Thermosediminibacter litoriperuensis TaxID=291989 RepID=A0A5S5AVI3_9FIRM|nr:4Fe-4S binding protein [Thermosediminibacter litoriperuensis]TYP56738.1 4Fe-4S binding protein [Thermosediminibacter litoriperuensis]
MKMVKAKPELCTGCGACMIACSKALYKVEDPAKSAIRVKEKPGTGVKYEIAVCNHCGECIPICSVEAVYRAKNGAVRIDHGKCVGCYMCVGFCPHNAIFVHRDINETIKCIACGSCVKACPTGAIYMEEIN